MIQSWLPVGERWVWGRGSSARNTSAQCGGMVWSRAPHGDQVGPSGVEVGASQAEPDDRVLRHHLGHLLELGDPIALNHHQAGWILSSGRSTRLTPLKLKRSSTL